MEKTVVELLGVESGNGTLLTKTFNISDFDVDPVSTHPCRLLSCDGWLIVLVAWRELITYYVLFLLFSWYSSRTITPSSILTSPLPIGKGLLLLKLS